MTEMEKLLMRITALESDFDGLWELFSRTNRLLRSHQNLIIAQSRALETMEKLINKKRED